MIDTKKLNLKWQQLLHTITLAEFSNEWRGKKSHSEQKSFKMKLVCRQRIDFSAILFSNEKRIKTIFFFYFEPFKSQFLIITNKQPKKILFPGVCDLLGR